MVVHNEYLGWQIEWPETMQNTLTQVLMDEDLWDKLREFVHEKFKNVDTFHIDCVTFVRGFDSMEEARRCEKELKQRVCAWINAYQ